MVAVAPLDEPTMLLRVVEVRDAGRTARLHLEALPGGFFVSLGPRFLRAYHRTFLTSPAGIALLAERDGETVGFIVGTVDEATHYRHVVRRDRWSLGARGLAALMSKPELLVRFVQTRLYRYLRGMVRLSRAPVATDNEGTVRATTGVLSHMAVDAAHRGDGVGAVLLDAFVDTAKAQGARSIRLSTAANNVAAQRFYERHGWQSGGQQTDADGQRWFHYGRRLR